LSSNSTLTVSNDDKNRQRLVLVVEQHPHGVERRQERSAVWRP